MHEKLSHMCQTGAENIVLVTFVFFFLKKKTPQSKQYTTIRERSNNLLLKHITSL